MTAASVLWFDEPFCSFLARWHSSKVLAVMTVWCELMWFPSARRLSANTNEAVRGNYSVGGGWERAPLSGSMTLWSTNNLRNLTVVIFVSFLQREVKDWGEMLVLRVNETISACSESLHKQRKCFFFLPFPKRNLYKKNKSGVILYFWLLSINLMCRHKPTTCQSSLNTVWLPVCNSQLWADWFVQKM